MHLAIYDEWTKRLPTKRIAVAAISAVGKPGQRIWESKICWDTKPSIQHGDTTMRFSKLQDLVEALQSWEISFREMGILSKGSHILIFCPFQLQKQVKSAFYLCANPDWELSNCSVHFPTSLIDYYGDLAYA